MHEFERRLDRLEKKVDRLIEQNAETNAKLRELAVRHETAKTELRKIWAVIAGVAAIVGGVVSQTVATWLQR